MIVFIHYATRVWCSSDWRQKCFFLRLFWWKAKLKELCIDYSTSLEVSSRVPFSVLAQRKFYGRIAVRLSSVDERRACAEDGLGIHPRGDHPLLVDSLQTVAWVPRERNGSADKIRDEKAGMDFCFTFLPFGDNFYTLEPYTTSACRLTGKANIWFCDEILWLFIWMLIFDSVIINMNAYCYYNIHNLTNRLLVLYCICAMP